MSKIVKMIEESEKLKSALESKAERMADRLVPYTLLVSALTGLISRNITKTAVDLTGCDFSTLTSMIDSGKPVILWGTLRIQPPQTLAYSWHVNGEEIPRYANLHCLVLTGYDKEKNVAYTERPFPLIYDIMLICGYQKNRERA